MLFGKIKLHHLLSNKKKTFNYKFWKSYWRRLLLNYKVFLKKYNLQEAWLASLKMHYEEDEDGLYDYCKEKGWKVKKLIIIDLGANIFIIKQM